MQRLAMLTLFLALSGAEKKTILVQKLSDEKPGTQNYDHEAFLGEGTAEIFNKLTPEESKRRLGIIFGKMDTDHDGIIHEKELEKWIEYAQKRHIEEDSAEKFKKYDLDKNSLVHWDEYYKTTFGELKDDDWKLGDNEGFSYEDMHRRDKKRFQAADTDKDNSCTITEFKAFVHPQHFPHMKDVVFEETMDDIDLNGDGYLDIDEYINDIYQPQDKDEPEPEWLAEERDQFATDRDKDGDGKLNEQEVREWIMPEDYNYALAEAKHLVHESDADQDGKLTQQEVTDHFDIFVGSQATNWGKIFERHDEF